MLALILIVVRVQPPPPSCLWGQAPRSQQSSVQGCRSSVQAVLSSVYTQKRPLQGSVVQSLASSQSGVSRHGAPTGMSSNFSQEPALAGSHAPRLAIIRSSWSSAWIQASLSLSLPTLRPRSGLPQGGALKIVAAPCA